MKPGRLRNPTEVRKLERSAFLLGGSDGEQLFGP